jgi:dTDP-4-dehydrorhamnose 3,5-epimerase
LPGAYVVDPEPFIDARGAFARTWCAREFAEHGLPTTLAQASTSYNPYRATLRGMHFQAPPFSEVKLVRCTRGAIFDVIIDLRPESPTFTQHFATRLTADDRRAMYVPEGFAHGFLTLVSDSEVFYQMSACYVPSAARGVRWNDPAFGIVWPLEARLLSPRDASYPDFERPLAGRDA